jgi:hypothetical protein
VYIRSDERNGTDSSSDSRSLRFAQLRSAKSQPRGAQKGRMKMTKMTKKRGGAFFFCWGKVLVAAWSIFKLYPSFRQRTASFWVTEIYRTGKGEKKKAPSRVCVFMSCMNHQRDRLREQMLLLILSLLFLVNYIKDPIIYISLAIVFHSALGLLYIACIIKKREPVWPVLFFSPFFSLLAPTYIIGDEYI